MRDKLKGAVLGALVAAFATVLLAQTPPWTAPRTWTTGDLLTASQFNSNFRDNLLNLRASAACADGGITGTASADTVLFGDCRWDSVPATTVVALDMGSTTTTASSYQTLGPTASIAATSSQSVSLYVSGDARVEVGCQMRLRNTTTATDLFDSGSTTNHGTETLAGTLFTDASPGVGMNEYLMQFRRVSGHGTCWWNTTPIALDTLENARGMIAVVL